MAAHPFVDFGSMPHLRALDLQVTLWTDQIPRMPPNHLPWLIAALRRIPAGVRVTLSCTIDDEDIDTIVVDAVDWTGLAQEITRLADAASVIVNIALVPPYALEVLLLIEDHLRDLLAREIVRVLPALEDPMDDGT